MTEIHHPYCVNYAYHTEQNFSTTYSRACELAHDHHPLAFWTRPYSLPIPRLGIPDHTATDMSKIAMQDRNNYIAGTTPHVKSGVVAAFNGSVCSHDQDGPSLIGRCRRPEGLRRTDFSTKTTSVAQHITNRQRYSEGSIPAKHQSPSHEAVKWLVIGLVIGWFVAIVIVSLLCHWRRRRAKECALSIEAGNQDSSGHTNLTNNEIPSMELVGLEGHRVMI